ncbi:hypothetical protein DENIS_3002 [Desulfonema ishimotonii]|uniref:Uncharacterized protein n=1 Tax=Desulfonema ishimotonii TaxID=45657 RepID=A0A401FYJ2_9BACT|nr:hypothetical protein [Desulfonema ishimotonii]GBC62039.1 hypothetical protein DENIS_3002 [Desulfonema ishimotonii]
MKKKPTDETIIGITLPGTSAADLMGRQSVRATFRLTEHAISAISIVAAHLGIKQKSLFDHLIEDIRSLEMIAREIESRSEPDPPFRVQKTYVISRKTLSYLEKACEQYDAPRDALVEYSVRRLLPLIVREREKHNRRKEILRDLKAYVRMGEALLEKSRDLLGEDDPVSDRIGKTVASAQNSSDVIETYIEKGKSIEEFEIY